MNRNERQRDFRDSLDEIWKKECTFLDQLFDLGVPLDPRQRMLFHDYVYHHCSSFVHNTSVRAQDPGKHLYENLTSYLTSRLKEMAAEMETIAEDEQLLIVYSQKWQRYQKACAELDFIGRYFNVNWVKRERQEGHKNIYEIYPMTMQRWKEIVFSPIDRSLTEAIARQKKYAAALVYEVLQSIVQLYANDVFQQTTVQNKLINVFGLKSGVIEFYTNQTTAMFQRILASKKYAGLKPFLKYACLAMPQIEEGEEFKEFIKDHIAPQLKDAIAKSMGAKDYIQAVLGLRHGPLARAIGGHKKLLSVIDHVCETAINSSEINAKMTAVELLVSYCHQLMKTNHPSEEELRDELKRIVEVVEFLFDKDKFFAGYKDALQNRQILETSTSDDMEVTMISQLQKRFGKKATADLSKQLDEMQSSNIIRDQFNTYLGDIKLGFDFRLKCFIQKDITSKVNLILPLELQQTVDVFKSFYAQTYRDRKVEFNFKLSSGEIIININQKSPYFVKVSMFQMALLLQFNQSDKYTVEELAVRLGTEIDTIKPVLDSCIREKILVCDGSLTPSSLVEVAREFTSRKRHLNINTVPTKQRKVENDDTELMKKRSFQLRAAVVRIMKRRMILNHSQLIIEVIEELRNQFKPDTKLIKKEIEFLITKDYITRSNDNSYTYVS